MTVKEAKKIVNAPEFGRGCFCGTTDEFVEAHKTLIKSGDLVIVGKDLRDRAGNFNGLVFPELFAK